MSRHYLTDSEWTNCGRLHPSGMEVITNFFQSMAWRCCCISTRETDRRSQFKAVLSIMGDTATGQTTRTGSRWMVPSRSPRNMERKVKRDSRCFEFDFGCCGEISSQEDPRNLHQVMARNSRHSEWRIRVGCGTVQFCVYTHISRYMTRDPSVESHWLFGESLLTLAAKLYRQLIMPATISMRGARWWHGIQNLSTFAKKEDRRLWIHTLIRKTQKLSKHVFRYGGSVQRNTQSSKMRLKRFVRKERQT